MKINITIDVPDGARVTVTQADADDIEDAHEREDELVLAFGSGAQHKTEQWIDFHAPATRHQLYRALLARIFDEFRIEGRPPRTGQRPYVSLFPKPKYGTSRVGALTLNTGRFYVVLDPALAPEFPGTEPAEAKYLAFYVNNDEEDFELAVSLLRRAMRGRGWERGVEGHGSV
ncbi:MAG: hypothetical protein QOF21_1557 [Actinomycetota bacterium]|jgi:hypothetical protein